MTTDSFYKEHVVPLCLRFNRIARRYSGCGVGFLDVGESDGDDYLSRVRRVTPPGDGVGELVTNIVEVDGLTLEVPPGSEDDGVRGLLALGVPEQHLAEILHGSPVGMIVISRKEDFMMIPYDEISIVRVIPGAKTSVSFSFMPEEVYFQTRKES